MDSSPRRCRARWLAIWGTAAVLMPAIGCAGGQEVTPEALDQAKRLWTQAGIRDYEVEWTTAGRNQAHYSVTVRDGDVRKVESVATDGQRVELHPAEARFFGVEGLFLTIANELALLKTDQPFGQPKGTKVVMRFQPDAKLGYPLWYRRDVLGTPLSVSIDVLKLTPVESGSKSPGR